MRTNRTRIKTRAAATVVGATLALAGTAAAAEPTATTPADDTIRTRAGFATEPVAEWAGDVARKQRREASSGPYVPVVGKVDYGTGENAFGAARSDHAHEGQDMFAAPGTPEVAVTDAVVAETGSDAGQGNYVYLYDTKRDRTYVYMHMIEPAKVSQGESVKAGQLLGGVGCTGSCWGEHLHFEVRDGRGFTGQPRDPMPLLADWRSLAKPR